MSYPNIEIKEQRHVYIVPGISREAFTATGQRMTAENTDLTYFVHQHKHDPYKSIPCNGECTIIRMGKVERVLDVTQSDDAKAPSAT